MDDETVADLAYLRDYAQYLLDQGLAHHPEAGKGILSRMKDIMDGIVNRHIPAHEKPGYWFVEGSKPC